ncbi:hypothetical protein [Jeotgalibacillus terrae]|uniref:DUF2140 domain-containing protein n=1 Tax=Jeotgalibacillus terrae TaxID=587735 RepID=A0ABW5ZFT8_9BACL|nr:hypothetical protein [Jeotgalibacillus terrae]MBM7579560.1 hypothetical protein [Jeotgalibacillus terrae]
MMILAQLIPLALIILIITLFLKTKNNSISVKQKKPRRKIVRPIFIGYTALLVISMAVYYILPASGEEFPEPDAEIISENEGWEVHEKAMQNRFDEIDPAYLEEQKTVEFPYTSLVLPEGLMEYGDPLIVVTIDGQLKDQIQMEVYKTPFTLSGIDITDEIVRPDVSFSNNLLTISNVYGQNNLNYVEYNPSLTVQPFLGEEREGLSSGFHYSYGVQVIHLRVPENVEIIGEVQQFQAQ